MRLIDADKLLDEMMINVDLQCNYDEIKHIIDNIEPKLYVNDNFLKTRIANITTRPQGRWICDDIIHCRYHCSECRSTGINIQPFCGWCGADMRGNNND